MRLEPRGQHLGRFARLSDLSHLNRPEAKRIILGIAALFLLIGTVVSLERNPEVLSNLDWRPLIFLVLVTVPATIALNAITFLLTGRLVGREFGVLAATEISIIGTAANLLPLPGGALVRVAALKAAGTGYGEGTKITLVVAGLWVGVAFLFAGGWMLRLGVGLVAVLFVAIGLAAWLSCFVLVVRRCRGVRLPLSLSLVKVALVTLDATRMFLCLSALGPPPLFDQTAALAVAGVVGNAVSIVPAGLGVREGVSAGLAPLVGLGAGMTFLATALNRLLGLITVLPIALGLLVCGRRRATREDTAT